jgi:exonuclease VII large subunit
VNAPFHAATPTTPATSVAPSDAEIIEQLKQQLDATTRHLNVTSQRLQLSELRVQVLEDKLRQQRIAKYGPGSEKLTNQQLELLELEPGVSDLEVAAEGERARRCRQPQTRRSGSILAARRCLRIFRAWSG